MGIAKPDRNQEMYQMWLAGDTYREIAEHYGVTRGRVYNILKKITKEDMTQSKYKDFAKIPKVQRTILIREGITTIDQLKELIETDTLTSVNGIGKSYAEKIVNSLDGVI